MLATVGANSCLLRSTPNKSKLQAGKGTVGHRHTDGHAAPDVTQTGPSKCSTKFALEDGRRQAEAGEQQFLAPQYMKSQGMLLVARCEDGRDEAEAGRPACL